MKVGDDLTSMIGQQITSRKFKSVDGQTINLQNSKKKILLFISIYCIRCLKLISEIINDYDFKTEMIIFSNAPDDENCKINSKVTKEVFIISLTDQEMLKYFFVTKHPFCIIVNEQNLIIDNKEVKNINDIHDIQNYG